MKTFLFYRWIFTVVVFAIALFSYRASAVEALQCSVRVYYNDAEGTYDCIVTCINPDDECPTCCPDGGNGAGGGPPGGPSGGTTDTSNFHGHGSGASPCKGCGG